MGSPPSGGGRHRLHEPDLDAPRTTAFGAGPSADRTELVNHPERPGLEELSRTEQLDGTRRLPRVPRPALSPETDRFTVAIPRPRHTLDEPTEVMPVLLPPPPVWHPRAAGPRSGPIPGNRWDVVLGGLVATACIVYIAIAGFGAFRSSPVGPTSSALGPSVVTAPASALPSLEPTPAPTPATPPTRVATSAAAGASAQQPAAAGTTEESSAAQPNPVPGPPSDGSGSSESSTSGPDGQSGQGGGGQGQGQGQGGGDQAQDSGGDQGQGQTEDDQGQQGGGQGQQGGGQGSGDGGGQSGQGQGSQEP
ncbi:hypothetical protein [Pseudonocardia thermophila]|uniref:hypothetical protein n=1 Tax=Pseudonocardia thermophila TaxID=1848 RepID=UPI00248F2FEF|nr:hypothetical protein [Pseudonocardia thermophila]